jgi:hypothetical protein
LLSKWRKRMKITPEQIAKLRTLCEAALDGPWEVGPTPRYLAQDQVHDGRSPLTIRAPSVHTEEIATVWTYLMPTEANAEFIAASREAMPALLDELEETQIALEEARKR